MKHLFILLVLCVLFLGCKDQSELPRTKRGFEYEQFKATDGAKPAPGDEVYFHYAVLAGDSLLQDSRPQIMAQRLIILPDSLITAKTHPFSDILPMMSIGDSTALYYPLDSFPKRPPGLDHIDDLTYILKLEHILKQKHLSGVDRLNDIKKLVEDDLQQYKNGQAENLKDLGDGLQAIIHEEGSGAKPKSNEYVSVHYYGMLEADAVSFDNSFIRSAPIAFPVGNGVVIKGWDQGLMALTKGSKATLFIPYDLAYGEQDKPSIPAKSNLVFYVEVLE